MKNNHFYPVHSAQPWGKWIDNLFNTTLSDVIGSDFALANPSVNIVEHEKHFTLDLAAPGLEKKDFNINIEDDHLVISAEKKSENEETEKGKFTRREFNYSVFKRSFYLDDTIHREGIHAAYENGVLRITLPKKEEILKKSSVTTVEIE